MPRSRWRASLLALSLLPLPLGACSSHGGGADAGAVAEPLTPLPAPAGHLGDLFIGTPGAFWGKARGTLGPVGQLLPQGFGAVATTLVGLPITLAAEIDDAVPVVGAAVRQGPGPLSFAIGIHVKAGERFVNQVTRGEGARFNGTVDPTTHVTLLTDKVAPESAKVALGVLGNYLIVAPTPADLYAVGPYVVRTLGPAAPPKDDIAVEIPDTALGGPLLDVARELRGKSEGIVAAIAPVEGLLDGAITLLGDAAHARATLNLEGGTFHGRLSVPPKPGGPGAKLCADIAVGDVKPLLALPDSTTVGLLLRESPAARSENVPKRAEALARFVGSDVSAEARAAISAALRGQAEARGDWEAVGVAFNGTGPTAVLRWPVTDADKMRKALKQLVDLGGTPTFKKALARLGVRLVTDKAVVENLAADVTRIRLAKPEDETKKDAAKARPVTKADVVETPKAIDLLYFVDGSGLFAAAGYDPKDSLRALTKAPAGANLGTNAAMAGALGAVGGEATFVLVADALRISQMTTGGAAPAATQPVVIAAGRTAAPLDLWARVDVPASVVQLFVQEYTRRRTGPP
jgi:hypothetical protein